MKPIAQRLDERLKQWDSQVAKEVELRVAEIIEMADRDALDVMCSRELEQQTLDILDGRQTQ
jgi:hypothetical protein